MKEYKKPAPDEIKKNLTAEQYQITQCSGTEPPFENKYWNHKEPGIYVDIVTGEPLFSSKDQFNSGTGWPSFIRPINPNHVIEVEDFSLVFDQRIEVRSKTGDSHLGHVFDDGPSPTFLRYCINSAALRFIPVKDLQQEGYGEFLSHFETKTSSALNPNPQSNSIKPKEIATLAGGCFWGMEELLRQLPGVLETKVGYCGGHLHNATYEAVKKGQSGHAESVQIHYDPTILSFEQLLKYFFKIHDPTTLNQQGNDRGTQYRSAIFCHSIEQRNTALRFKQQVELSQKWNAPVVTEIVDFQDFYDAEEYHQKYLVKNPGGYTCHFLRD